MKLSEILSTLGSDEYFQATVYVFIYQMKNGNSILKQVQRVEDDMRIISRPPVGNNKVTNIYWDPAEGKIAVEYDNNPVT